MSEDYCVHCGCPKDICCGQGKVSLEWLEKEFEKRLFALIKQYGRWTSNLNDSVDFGDYFVRELEIKNMLKELILEAKKQVGEK